MLTEHTFQAGDVRIHYAEGPASGMPLVLLHGATLRWQSWMSVLPLFAFRYHTYALDLRGHGNSAHASTYRLRDYSEDIICFLREQVRAPAVLMGRSLGAEVAWWVAAHAPDLVRAAVLEDPALYLGRDARFPNHPIYHILSSLYARLQTPATVSQLAAAVQSLVPELDHANALGWAKSLSLVDPVAIAHAMDGRTFADDHPDQLFPKIAAPILLLQGNPANDGMIEPADLERALGQLTNCVHVYRADTGHSISEVIPMPYFQIVTSFLESL